MQAAESSAILGRQQISMSCHHPKIGSASL